jgi:hypothetical protein
VEAAREAIRQLKATSGLPEGGVTVYLRGGDYYRTETFELTAADSGTAECPIIYRAYGGEQVRFIGGVGLEASWFTPVDSHDAVWNRLDPSAQGQLLVADLSAHGITDYGQLLRRAGWGWNNIAPAELFFNGAAMTLGRTEGWMTISATPDGRYGATFTADGAPLSEWTQAEDVWFSGLFGTYWYNAMVGGQVNAATGTMTLDAVPQYGLLAGKPFYAFNLLEEIDTPGEYYLNRDSGRLYFWAPAALTGSSEIVLSQMSDDLLELTNTQYLSFQGITFEATRGGLVSIHGGAHNQLYGCTLRNAGTYGANISGTDNGLDHCVITATGERGVLLSGGDRPSLTAAGNYVTHTDLSGWGRWVGTSKVGIHIEGVGQIVSHNLMHEAPSGALWFYGNNHLIEYNDIYNVCNTTSDAGAIYAGRDWSFQGNVIKYNFIHDLSSPFTTWEIFGVYLDDAASGITVTGNIFYNIDGFATFNAGGRDNLWTNNVIAECYGGHRTDRRGVDIITNVSGDDCNFLQKLNLASGGTWQSGVWAQAYPNLLELPSTFDALGDYKNPGGTVFADNVGYDLYSSSKWLSEGAWGGTGALDWYAQVADNLYGQDPLFVDAAGGDFNLRANSPAFGLAHFQAIPFDLIGIQNAPRRDPIPDPQPQPDPPPDPTPTGEVIVDNTSAGFTAVGDWKESGAVDEYNGSSLHANAVGSTARWTPTLTTAGVYDVYVWYAAQASWGGTYDRDSAADYTVHYAGGTTTVQLDQHLNSGQWVLLGSFAFDAGSDGYVQLTRDSLDGLATSADAVRFVLTV